jgi:hypothetical protein
MDPYETKYTITLQASQPRKKKMFQLFEVSAYNQTDGKIILKPKALTAKSQQVARDKAVQLLPNGTDLDETTVVVRPLG